MDLNYSSADFAFLDSGTGGIPYMLALKQKQPDAKCVYLGDTEHFPYGEKSVGQITECASKAISLIVSRWNPKTLIIACNTISVTALDRLRSIFPQLPIVGTVPAIKLAAKVTKNRRIGFLATNASVNSPYSQKLIDDFARDCTVYRRGDPELVRFVEKDFFTATEEQKSAAVKPAAEYFLSSGCDTVILGCTHFTHIARDIQKACGPAVKVIDSREGVSNQAIKVESAEKTHPHSEPLLKTPYQNLSFYATAATATEEQEYKTLCQKLNIPWGGVVEN